MPSPSPPSPPSPAAEAPRGFPLRAHPGSTPPGDVLAVCSDIPYEPFEFGPSDDLTGFDVDLVDAIGERLGRPVSFVATPLDQFATSLADGRCRLVASAVPIDEHGATGLVFSDPYLHVDQSLLVRKDDASTLTGLAALDTRTVGVVVDSPGADLAAGLLGTATVQGFATIGRGRRGAPVPVGRRRARRRPAERLRRAGTTTPSSSSNADRPVPTPPTASPPLPATSTSWPR